MPEQDHLLLLVLRVTVGTKNVREDLKRHLGCLLQQSMQPPHSPPSSTPTLLEAWSAVRGDPAKDLAKNIAQNDLRFRGVLRGEVMHLPSWPQELYTLSSTPIVAPRPGEDALHKAGLDYARRYNRLLLTHLQKVRHPLVQEAIFGSESTMQRLEKLDPKEDAQRALRESPGTLFILAVANSRLVWETPGMRPLDKKHLESQGCVVVNQPLPITTVFLSRAQRSRLARLCARYMFPYNRYLMAHGQRGEKKDAPSDMAKIPSCPNAPMSS